jgi:preprotein translocase subunit SecY
MIGIVARMPANFIFEAGTRWRGAGGPIALIVELILWFVVVLGTVMLVQGTRRVPVQYARRIVGNKQYGGVRQYIPLKVNAAGVMPIIFAQAIMMLPTIIAGYSSSTSAFVIAFSNMYGFWYNVVTGLLIILFTYFYTAITINPVQMAEDMKKNGGFIPGIKPGRKTVEFFDNIMSRITLPGSIFLAIIAILPSIAVKAGITSQFAQFFGGTTILILVGVVLDTLQQIESHLLMRHYDGLMKSGRVKGRAGSVTSI